MRRCPDGPPDDDRFKNDISDAVRLQLLAPLLPVRIEPGSSEVQPLRPNGRKRSRRGGSSRTSPLARRRARSRRALEPEPEREMDRDRDSSGYL